MWQIKILTMKKIILFSAFLASNTAFSQSVKYNENKDPISFDGKISAKSGYKLSNSKILYILDGKEISSDAFRTIDRDKIELVNVYKNQKAVELFGERGRNGVIEIKTKKEEKNVQTNEQPDLILLAK